MKMMSPTLHNNGCILRLAQNTTRPPFLEQTCRCCYEESAAIICCLLVPKYNIYGRKGISDKSLTSAVLSDSRKVTV